MVAKVFDVIDASPVDSRLEIWMTGLMKNYEIVDIKLSMSALGDGRLRTMVIALCQERARRRVASSMESLVDAHDPD